MSGTNWGSEPAGSDGEMIMFGSFTKTVTDERDEKIRKPLLTNQWMAQRVENVAR